MASLAWLAWIPLHGLSVYTAVDLSPRSAVRNRVMPQHSPELEALLSHHRLAMFHDRSPTEFQAMTITGVYEQEGQAIPFVVRQMRPHFYRIDLELPDGHSSQIFDNYWGWFLEEHEGSRQVRWMSWRESRNMRRDSHLFNYLIEWPREDVTLKWLPENEEGEPGVQVTLNGGDVIVYRLDPQTYLVSKEIKLDTSGRGFRVMEHGDYRQVDGVALSHKVTHYLLGQQIAQLRIDGIAFESNHPQLIFTAPILDKPVGYPEVQVPTVGRGALGVEMLP